MIKLRELRKKKNLTMNELGEILGVTQSSICLYETGKRQPDGEMLIRIAEFFDVSVDYLLGRSEKQTTGNSGVKIPVLGHVRAGIPLDAVEEILDYEEISPDLAARGEYFALQIKGDSMEPKFSEGDVVIVRKQSDVDSGKIAVVLVNGDGATVKKIKKRVDGVELIPTNPMYDVMFFDREQIETLPVRIIGKVVELRAKF